MVALVLLLAVSASCVLCSPIHNGPPPFEGTWEDIYNPKRSPIHNGPPPFEGTWEDIYNPKRAIVPPHVGPPPIEGTWEDIYNPRIVEAPFKGHKVYKMVPETDEQVQ